MGKRYLLLMLGLLVLVCGLRAEDKLYIEDFVIRQGETKTVEVMLDNPDVAYRDMQFNLYLPAGVSIAKNQDGRFLVSLGSRCTSNHSTVVTWQNDHYVVVLYSGGRAALGGNSGAVMSLTLEADANAAIGKKEGQFRNVSLSKVNATGPTYEGFSFNVTVSGALHTLTYVVDGQTYKTYEVEYGASITAETAPSKEGYSFTGWSEIPATMPAKDVMVIGTFSVNKYKLIYTVDSKEYKSYEVEYGTSITAEVAPTKEGHTFSGWSEIPATMPAKDVTVTGTFSKGAYQIVYVVDGQTYKIIRMDFGSTITLEDAPTKEGYTFSGWSEIPEMMPAKDVTVIGTFSINKYKLTYSVDGKEYKSYEVEYGTSITAEAVPTREGSTFSGWSEIPATMPAKDVSVTGTFSINKYTLTYIVDGETYKSYELEYGANISAEAAPTKEGYTFSGWSDIPATMPAKDVTVTGSFTKGAYQIIYLVDGQTYKTIRMDFNSSITPEDNPTKEGYTFSGWSEIPVTMPAKDVTVTGSFTINKYKLVYQVDGKEYKSYEIEFGSTITAETAPTKEGHTFSGWSEIPEAMPAKDVTVTGTFSVNKYKLTYTVDGKEYKSYEMEYGASITAEAAPIKDGYTFSGWSEIPATMPAKDVSVAGTFTINKYTLTYIVDGETYKTYEVEYGASIVAEDAPTKEGHSFSGWSEIPATMPAKNVTVTGSFSKGAYQIIYMVDDQTYKIIRMDFGSSITPEDAPTKEGYTFFGWSEIPATMPAKDVTVTGTFTINKYKLTYQVDGQEYKSYEIEYGTNITAETAPTKEGHTFSGWSEIPATMPAKDVTVTGSFSKGTYQITYVVDGQTYKTIRMDFGSTIIPEDAPTKEGYTFSGWNEIPATMPAKDVTVIGTFSINKYKLTYTVDGETHKTYEMEYGTSITAEAAPTKEGHTFSGWSEIPATMPAKDVIVTGSFTINKYTLTYIVDGESYKTYEVEYGASITAEDAPAKEGHTFSGWSEIPATMPAKDVIVTGTFIPLPNSELIIQLEEGWNWISHNVANSLNPTEVFGENVIEVKNQTKGLIRDTQYGMVGNLKELVATEAYKVKTTEADTEPYQLSDQLFDTEAHAINLKKGWNWIGYPMANEATIEDALKGFTPMEGDCIVGQDDFSTYTGSSWDGLLVVLTPGKGYMYRSGETKSVHFSKTAEAKAREAKARIEETAESSWTCDIHKYPNRMPTIARLYIKDVEADASDYDVAAFCGDECRGVGKVVKGVLMMNVCGEGGEDITFKAIDKTSGIVLNIQESVSFSGDVLGAYTEPFRLTISGESITGIATIKSETAVDAIYNVAGQRISTDKQTLSKGVYIYQGKKVMIK
ncbi:MAG: InlB B-repeat-containing protein [Bacteroidaceae bacterium]|nr:InlB B-repeat-containing protein [Bacteroidaceae bacterium]